MTVTSARTLAPGDRFIGRDKTNWMFPFACAIVIGAFTAFNYVTAVESGGDDTGALISALCGAVVTVIALLIAFGEFRAKPLITVTDNRANGGSLKARKAKETSMIAYLLTGVVMIITVVFGAYAADPSASIAEILTQNLLFIAAILIACSPSWNFNKKRAFTAVYVRQAT